MDVLVQTVDISQEPGYLDCMILEQTYSKIRIIKQAVLCKSLADAYKNANIKTLKGLTPMKARARIFANEILVLHVKACCMSSDEPYEFNLNLMFPAENNNAGLWWTTCHASLPNVHMEQTQDKHNDTLRIRLSLTPQFLRELLMNIACHFGDLPWSQWTVFLVKVQHSTRATYQIYYWYHN